MKAIRTLLLVIIVAEPVTMKDSPGQEANAQKCGSVMRDGRYVNPGEVDITPKKSSASLFYRFFIEERKDQEPKSKLPLERRTASDYADFGPEGTRITWLGHSAMLIEISGARLLTDPNFSQRASPVGWAGPKRFHPPPINARDLPALDAVLISHDHYDHLDYDTIIKLKDKAGLFITPIGVGKRLVEWGVAKEKVVELEWWEESKLDSDITIALTPAQHFSARGIFDRNKTLWGSWVVMGDDSRVYFSGDTGMFGCFADIGKKYGPFDYTLMHIGAYADVWPAAHLTPEEAVAAHVSLRGDVFIPMHWGTFRMAFHPWKEPAQRAYAEALRLGVKFATPVAGQMIESGKPFPVKPWWRELE